MRGRLTSGNVAALVLGILLLGSGLARTAAAFEWDLPGERKFSIHGFYESRLMFVGSELPLNGATWSSFRHVLSTELELTLFPDGFGPFDSMFMFSRFLVSYDCIYTRACGLANSADSYGDYQRKAVRQPLSLREDVKNNQPYFAGLLPQTYRAGTFVPSQEELNPSRRYRDCENPPGVFSNPFPLAVFCNLNNRSPLDNPNNQTGNKFWEVRAGTFHPFTRPSLTAAARPTIGDAEYTRLQNLLTSGQVLSRSEAAQRAGLLAEAAEVAKRGGAGDAQLAADLNAEAAAILGTPEDTFDANIPELLATRPDPNRFGILANDMAPELLEAKWGSSKLRNLVWPFLATINTPIKPEGYFAGGGALDTVGQNDQALGETIKAEIGGLPTAKDNDGFLVFQEENAKARANPFFVGPDGVRDTDDDLPYVTNNLRAQAVGYALGAPIQDTAIDRFDVSVFEFEDPETGAGIGPAIAVFSLTAQINVQPANDLDPEAEKKLVELYGVYTPEFLASQGCATVGGTFNWTTAKCSLAGGEDATAAASQRGCVERAKFLKTINIGRNADGDCIEMNMSAAPKDSEIQFEVIGLLGDLRARPEGAINEPLDATDFRSVADGGANNTMPARPRASENGIVFQSPGAREQYEQYHSLVSNLDLKYSVDSLQWNHGASQREHEFAEGYLEFEMVDSQVYARLGKLIVVWGKTELFRNQDRNNPLDIGNGIFAPLEEQRVGQWAMDLTFSPEAFMRVGPVEDMRLEFLTIFNPFEPTDLGKCGEGTAVDIICLKSFGSMANGLAGIGVIGEHRPYDDYSGMERWDFGARLEGRLDRFTFAISDFWGWDDGFYLDMVQQYERTSDPTTGAPLTVNTINSGSGCKIRTKTVETEEGTEQVAVGPDGNAATTGDNAFPSAGECLLWAPPDTPDGPQTLRSADAVASLQNVNQTLFHSLCAYTFDPDEGFCAFDRVNYPADFGLISNILSGVGFLGAILLDGVETIRQTNPDGSDASTVVQRGTQDFLSQQFLAIEPLASQNQDFQDLGVSLQTGQAALLGCGEAYASACSKFQLDKWKTDPAITKDLTRDALLGPSELGGVDLMNADASVVTQEFVGLKALSPGALVGTKLTAQQQLYYQAGMNFSRNGQMLMDVDRDFTRQGVQRTRPAKVERIEGGEYLDLTPSEVINLGVAGRAEYQIQPGHMLEADSWIEPMPWTVNQEMLDKFGAIVFNTDRRNVLNLNSPLNRWNLIDPNQDPNDLANIDYSDIDGEYCGRWMNRDEPSVATPFNIGCTGLETVSANFERLLISLEIIGADRVFDAPESLQELSFWSQSNTARQAAGDPISGPDGIFGRNQSVISDDEVDFEVISATPQPDSAFVSVELDGETDPHAAAEAFLRSYEPQESCTSDFCYFEVNNVMVDPDDANPEGKSLVVSMPIGFGLEIVTVADPNNPNDPNQAPIPTGFIRKVNLAKLQYFDLPTLRRLLARQAVAIETEFGPEYVQMNEAQSFQLIGEFGSQVNRGRDLDVDSSSDLDRNRDGIWDGQDDGLPGPITDDNILCGSGIPGDVLQDGEQYSPYRADEGRDSEAFQAMFPNGLPPRSPVFCRGVAGLLGATTQTLPVRKAGGDGRYGRRDFLWQGGRQVAFDYQKRNVFGFGLDFAEDTTKTSWGLEFSWMARKLFANSLEYDGLSQSDEMVLSISVDRPTFFNYLNPNRSFFMNLQMFLRYLPDYQGGQRNGDGMYGSAGAQLTGNVAFTFFTGYFQDRLAPRVTILYAPWESQGALITGLSYRWNDAFSTSIGFTQFFGHVYGQQGPYFPIAQYGSIADNRGAVLRGVAPVLYRDQAELRIRYTW